MVSTEKKIKQKPKGIPEPTIRRMPKYHDYVKRKKSEGEVYLSAPRIAHRLRLDPTQVTKDLAYTGITGRPRIGYNVDDLLKAIENFLGFNHLDHAFLIGAGSLGTALVGYPGFEEYGVKIVAAFDNNPAKVGSKIRGVPVLHIDKFRDLAERMHVAFGIITTPAEQAQQIADLMISWGIKAIWNFSPINIIVPEHIIIQNTSIYANLAVIMNKLHYKMENEEVKNQI
ncbi:MAG: redox-sensing transcriptional repressor Rex [Chloroflexia bacterium]|nr:redox-sensing transcriptional repressor Rex [Chloroflexia bacterium]